ncbi:hypothetical protein FGO68_gene4822 [Halteria grandinella]|uniref:Uncharacterized protein n=1 Tax=Halteria grandinella TaxID=5974 RepID=A0A8J8T6R5_HALGN|nr:hypothetical protein FGO68_gene4822 [Halteria grandinella]
MNYYSQYCQAHYLSFILILINDMSLQSSISLLNSQLALQFAPYIPDKCTCCYLSYAFSVLYDVDRFGVICNSQALSDVALAPGLQVLGHLGLLHFLRELGVQSRLKVFLHLEPVCVELRV